jgi:hypothetical protein
MENNPAAGTKFRAMGAAGVTFEAYPNRQVHLGSLPAARTDWEQHRRFADVPGLHSSRLTAPQLVRFARLNPAS